MNNTLYDKLHMRFPALRLLQEEPMKLHTSFRIGGAAEAMAFPSSADELYELLVYSRDNAVPVELIGAGTNVLAPDEGIRGLVICTREMQDISLLPGGIIRAGCGVTLARAAVFALENGLTGLEFAHGIPGTVGGGVYMNAGAYGGEMAQVITSVTALCGNTVRRYSADELQFGYRHSSFTDTDYIILTAEFSLLPGVPEQIRGRMQELSAKRRASQPLEFPSAGSTFKRPVGGYAAALIDAAGLKGVSVGGARVSEKHAGFVINSGNATQFDVIALMHIIIDKVYESSGIRLEPEVRIIGVL